MSYIQKTYFDRTTVYMVEGTELRTVVTEVGVARVNVVLVRTISGYGHVVGGRVRAIRETELRNSSMWKAVEL